MKVFENPCSAEHVKSSPCITQQFVAPEMFLQYATSNRPIIRDDDEAAGLLGLLDIETGERFVIKSHQLIQMARRTVG